MDMCLYGMHTCACQGQTRSGSGIFPVAQNVPMHKCCPLSHRFCMWEERSLGIVCLSTAHADAHLSSCIRCFGTYTHGMTGCAGSQFLSSSASQSPPAGQEDASLQQHAFPQEQHASNEPKPASEKPKETKAPPQPVAPVPQPRRSGRQAKKVQQAGVKEVGGG